MRLWRQRLTQFLFPTQSDNWLTLLRIGLGLQVLLYALSLHDDWNYLLAGPDGGLSGRALSEALLSRQSPLVPRLGWLVTLGSQVDISEWTVLLITWWLLLCAAVCLLAGFFTRASAIAAWFVHLCAAKSGGLVSYGVDNFMTIGLFYLMLSPLPDEYSLDRLWRKLPAKNGQLLGFFRRLLQLHLSIIYFFSGLTKCLGNGWWDGSNIWRALIRPPFNIIPAEILVRWKYLFPVTGISVCLLEIGYPIFIWLKRTRTVWLILILVMHAAIGFAMGMYLFALIMIILNVSAFGPAFAPRCDEAATLREQELS
jgi:hypothetical protein